jgi:hypothetical protein
MPFQPWVPRSIKLDPRFRIVFFTVGESELGVGSVWSDKAENLAIISMILIITGILVIMIWSNRRGIINVAREKYSRALVVECKTNRVILMSAVATEVCGIEPLFWVTWEKLLAFNGNGPATLHFQSRECVSCTGDELMELKCEEATAIRLRRARSLDLWQSRDKQ